MHLLSVFSLRNRALIALVTIVVGVFGSIALTSLKQELIPSLTFPQLVVVTSYPGAAPEVVDQYVSGPIETAIQGVDGLESTTATSSTNRSSVSASFAYGTDLISAEQKVERAINRIKSTLPADVDPQVITGSIDDLPVVQIAATSDLDARDLTAAIQGSTLTDIQSLKDVRQASLLGTTAQRVSITPDATKLAAAGLTAQAIRDALNANGALLPAGSITENDKTLSVQAGSRLGSVDDIAALPLVRAASLAGPTAGPQPGAANNAATPLTIADVASVALVDSPITGISRVNGEPALTIAVTKTPAGNTVAVSKDVRALVPDLQKALGHNTQLTVVFDQAPFIQQSIDSLATEGLLGLFFAVIVILIFLMSIRSTLVTAISIPVSVFITFIGMQAANYTLNIITLGALTIAIGRVVDDSIVVIENIKRHLTLGDTKVRAITSAVREVATAVTASTITTVAVFLPLALVSDITGELFRPFALTVTIALGASLFVALTIVPVLAYWFLGKQKQPAADPTSVPPDAAIAVPEAAAAVPEATAAVSNAVATAPNAAIAVPEATAAAPAATAVAATRASRRRADPAVTAEEELAHPTRLQRGYLPVIHWTLKRPAVTILVAFLVLGGTVALVPSLKTNFIGDSGQNTLTVTQKLPLGASLDAQDKAATVVEKALRDTKGIETVQTSIGTGGSSLAAAFGGGGGISFSVTTDPDVNQATLQTTVRDELSKLTGVGDVALAAASSGFASSDIRVNITASNNTQLRTAADAVLASVKDLDVTGAATSNLSASLPYIAVVVDRDKAADAGLSEMAVGGIVSQAMQPSAVGSVVIDEKTMSIYINNASTPTSAEELKAFTVPTAAGPMPLSDLASVETVNGPASITSIKGLRSATVSVTPKHDDVGTASAVVAQAVDKVALPAGAKAELGGVASQQSDAFGQLGLALLVAILIVYVVMVATFKSLRQPLLLLVSIPFAATGGIILQVISGVPLGVPSLIGVLMLVGIVVTNAIVLVDLINQYRTRGMRVGDAIVHGASRRLRPILMTALATIFALLPMAIGVTGHGGFISQPLALVVIGGLVSSTLLTLVVLPVLYYLVEGAKERRLERRASSEA